MPHFQRNWGGGFQNNPGFFFSNWGENFARLDSLVHPFSALQDVGLRNQFPQFIGRRYAYKNYDSPENFFRTGIISNSSVNLTGSTERVGYNASVGYVREQGFLPGNELKRLNLGMGFNARLTDKITLITSFNYANTDMLSPPLNAGDGNNTLNGFPSVFANVFFTPRSVDLMGLPFEAPADNRSVYFRSGNDIPNPRWITKYYTTTGLTNRFFGTATLNADLAKDLTLTYRSGLDTYNEMQEYRFNKGGVDFLNGGYFTANIQNTILNNDLILGYTRAVTDKLTIAGKLGANLRNDRFRVDNTNSLNQLAFGLMRHQNFVDQTANTRTTEETRMGVYGDLTVDYNNYLFANFAARNDWTSTVEAPNRSIFYPSGSLSFVPTEAFKGLQSNVVNYVKLRAGVGTSAGFPSPYNTRNILNQVARGFLTPGGQVLTTHSVDNVLGNPNLMPELQQELETGLEARLFQNRLTVDATFYNRNTRNLITSTPLDTATGYTSTTINIGRLRNRGFEVGLSGTVLKRGDFAFCGLIGSATKRARFEHRLQAEGLDTSRLVCPIGLPGIEGKEPAVIAVAVVAQLLQLSP